MAQNPCTEQQSLSLAIKLALTKLGKFLIVFSTKVNLPQLRFSIMILCLDH